MANFVCPAMEGRRVMLRKVDSIRPDAKLSLSVRFALIRRVAHRRQTARASESRPARAVVVAKRGATASGRRQADPKGRRGGGAAAAESASRSRKQADRNGKDKPKRKEPRAKAAAAAGKGKGGASAKAPKAAKAPKSAKESADDVEKDFAAYLTKSGRGHVAAALDIDAQMAEYRAGAKKA